MMKVQRLVQSIAVNSGVYKNIAGLTLQQMHCILEHYTDIIVSEYNVANTLSFTDITVALMRILASLVCGKSFYGLSYKLG